MGRRLGALVMVGFLVAVACAARAATICGGVYDDDTARPVVKASVSVLDASGQETGFSAITNDRGEFCIDGPEAGTYRLEVKVDEYLTRIVRDVQISDDTSPIRINADRSEVMMGPPWPNPGSSRVSFAFDLASTADVRLSVYDTRGRLIQNWSPEARVGNHKVDWDFRDLDGNPIASGLYFVRLETPDVELVRPLLRIR
jgi:hypothetical protein